MQRPTGADCAISEHAARVAAQSVEDRSSPLSSDCVSLVLAAAAYVAGHRSTEMAGRVYVSPQADSAESALRARAREERGAECGTECGTEEKWQGMETRIPYDFRQTRQDSNLRPLPPEGSALSS